MNVGVFGLGYVGSVTAACLASIGHQVVAIDINPAKVEAINSGRSPVLERDLDALVRRVVRAGDLRATADAAQAVAHGDALLICVGTPSDRTGNLDFEHIDRVCVQIAGGLRSATGYRVVVLRSTLLPRVLGDRLSPLLARTAGKQAGEDFGVAVNPEFLREGNAVADFLSPPFTLIGQGDDRAGDVVQELYKPLAAPVIRTDPDAACMVKYASNAFHALKVVFANEIGQLCKRIGVDGTGIMEIVCQDTRLTISSRYLQPGFAFGGSCLPKDLRALQYLARHNDLQLPVIESILPSNRMQIQSAVDLILREDRKKVGVIGLAFKPGTDDLRESPVVELVEILSGKGAQVRIYDQHVNLSRLTGRNKAFIESAIPHIASLLCDSIEEVVESSEVVVVAHEEQADQGLLAGLLRPDQHVVDLVKIAHREGIPRSAYEGICW